MIVAIGSDAQRRTYLVDREARTHVLLAEYPAPDLAAALAPMRPVTIPSRDGLRLHGYLTLPRGSQAKAACRWCCTCMAGRGCAPHGAIRSPPRTPATRSFSPTAATRCCRWISAARRGYGRSFSMRGHGGVRRAHAGGPARRRALGGRRRHRRPGSRRDHGMELRRLCGAGRSCHDAGGIRLRRVDRRTDGSRVADRIVSAVLDARPVAAGTTSSAIRRSQRTARR